MSEKTITGRFSTPGYEINPGEVIEYEVVRDERVGAGAARSRIGLGCTISVSEDGAYGVILTLDDGDLDPREIESDGDLGVRLRITLLGDLAAVEAAIVWDEDEAAEA